MKALIRPIAAALLGLGLGGSVWADGLQGRRGAGMAPPLWTDYAGGFAPGFGPQDIAALAARGANVARVELVYVGAPALNCEDYLCWLDSALAYTETMMPVFQAYRIKVILDLHSLPGGRSANGEAMFFDPSAQQTFIAAWDRIIDRFGNNPTVCALDLANEPMTPFDGTHYTAVGKAQWRTLAIQVCQRIRQRDQAHFILFEPTLGSVDQLRYFAPLPFNRVVYSFHFYTPMKLTHQGIEGRPTGVTYPGVVNGEMWNRERIREAMAPAVQYQAAHPGTFVFIGEFSCVRWAPGDSASRFIGDVISVASEFGFGWSYHAFREADCWNVEHVHQPGTPVTALGIPATHQTASDQVLRHAWLANH